ncbi:hypothetical protein [Spirosoma jeollabukense]
MMSSNEMSLAAIMNRTAEAAKDLLKRYFSHYNRTGGPASPASSFDWLRNRTDGPDLNRNERKHR